MIEVVTNDNLFRLACVAARRVRPSGIYDRGDVIGECAMRLLNHSFGQPAGTSVVFAAAEVGRKLGMQFQTATHKRKKPQHRSPAEGWDVADPRSGRGIEGVDAADAVDHCLSLIDGEAQAEAVRRHLSGSLPTDPVARERDRRNRAKAYQAIRRKTKGRL